MLERCIHDAGGSYLFCDTDSMCIVGSEKSELIPCIGGSRKFDGKDAAQSLSLRRHFEGRRCQPRGWGHAQTYSPTLRICDCRKTVRALHTD